MSPVEFVEIKNIAEYELERPEWRPYVLAEKDLRRVRVGGHLTFLFENRDTVRYQVQEMMRIERIVREQDIRHELETYNELIPGKNELCASLLIEYDTPEERGVWLRRLLGLENHVWIEVNGARSQARFDTRQIATDRISSVQYLKFILAAEMVSGFASGARIVVDHPALEASTLLTQEQIQALTTDLAG